MAKRPIWSGSLSFGLVHIPVRLYGAVSQKSLHFNQLHDKDGGRIRQKRVCSVDGEEVPYENIVKGYEVAKDQYVVVSPEEMKSFEAKMSKAIEIEDFVDLDEIDPVYYESTYHLVPDPQALKAFGLLTEAMKKARKVGIARIVLRSRTSLCAVRPMGEGLSLSTMNAADEIVSADELGEMPDEVPVPSERELAMAGQLIEALSTNFDPTKYKDEYREKLMEFIQKKAEGNETVGSSEEETLAPVVNLMDALKKSLERKLPARPDAPVEGRRRHRAEAARTARPSNASKKS